MAGPKGTLQTDVPLGKLDSRTEVVAAAPERAKALLITVDDFVANQSAFDRQARLSLVDTTLEVTQSIYLGYVAGQVMAWTEAEVAALRAIVAANAERLKGMPLGLPAQVFVVKTTGKEEGNAAYTRRDDTIVLPQSMVASLSSGSDYGDPLHPAGTGYLEGIVTHETFHLLSKNDQARRAALYAQVHYELTPRPVALPDVPWPRPDSLTRMPQLAITNPDTPRRDAFLEMQAPADPASPPSPGDPVRPLLPILMASDAYRGGSFFDYLQWYFMLLERDQDGTLRAALGGDGRPVLYDMSAPSAPLLPRYLELVGRNTTEEIFHADEVLAQNFVFVASLPSLRLLDKMSTVLREATPARA